MVEMRKHIKVISLFMISFSVVLFSAGNALAGAKLESISGDVKVISGGDSEKASEGTAFEKDMMVETAKGASVLVVWDSGHKVKIDQLSRVKASDLSDKRGKEKINLDLETGKVFAQVDKLKSGSSFAITTPTAIAAVRGTSYMVESTEAGTTIASSSGELDITALDQDAILTDGMMITITTDADTMPEPEPAPDSVINAINQAIGGSEPAVQSSSAASTPVTDYEITTDEEMIDRNMEDIVENMIENPTDLIQEEMIQDIIDESTADVPPIPPY